MAGVLVSVKTRTRWHLCKEEVEQDPSCSRSLQFLLKVREQQTPDTLFIRSLHPFTVAAMLNQLQQSTYKLVLKALVSLGHSGIQVDWSTYCLGLHSLRGLCLDTRRVRAVAAELRASDREHEGGKALESALVFAGLGSSQRREFALTVGCLASAQADRSIALHLLPEPSSDCPSSQQVSSSRGSCGKEEEASSQASCSSSQALTGRPSQPQKMPRMTPSSSMSLGTGIGLSVVQGCYNGSSSSSGTGTSCTAATSSRPLLNEITRLQRQNLTLQQELDRSRQQVQLLVLQQQHLVSEKKELANSKEFLLKAHQDLMESHSKMVVAQSSSSQLSAVVTRLAQEVDALKLAAAGHGMAAGTQ